MNAYTVRINPKSRSKPVSIKEAYALGYHDSEHGFPDGSDYDADLPNWTADIGTAYEEGFQQRDKERRIKTMKKNPIGTAEELIARAYKEGLIDGKSYAPKDSYYTKDAPKELKLSYLDGYSKGKRENPSKWAKHSTSKSMLHCGISDGQNGLPPNPEFKHFTAYQMGYEKGKRYNVNPMKKNSIVRINPDKPLCECGHPYNSHSHGEYKGCNIDNCHCYYYFRARVLKKKNSTVRINPLFTSKFHKGDKVAIKGILEDHNKIIDEGIIIKVCDSYEPLEAYTVRATNGYEYILPEIALVKQNPKAMKKNSTVRINPSKEYFHDEDPIWVRDQGKYDVESGRPYRGEKYGKLRGEYDNGYNHGLRMEKAVRENRHLRLQFEKNPKSKKQLPFRRFFPKIKPGRPAGGPKGGYWWILDIFDAKDRKLGHLIGKGTKEKATLDAKYKVGDKYRGKTIERAMLSGPYDRKPTSKTKRK